MPRYRVHGVRKDTLNASHGTFYAYDEEVASELADGSGMYVEEIDCIEPEPATVRQIAFAGRLGISLPDDCDIDEASSLISNALENDAVASDDLFKIAGKYKLYTTRYSGEMDIYNRLLPWLSRPGYERELTEWFVYNLYRDKIKNRNDISIEGPHDHKVWSISLDLSKDQRVVKSIRRYEGKSLLSFGFQDLPNGKVTTGGSRNTVAYKAANKLIIESIRFWAKPSHSRTHSQNKGALDRNSDADNPPLLHLLLALAITLPLSGLFIWFLYTIGV